MATIEVANRAPQPEQKEPKRRCTRSSGRSRNTRRKRALQTVLGAVDGFLSASELHDRLRAHLDRALHRADHRVLPATGPRRQWRGQRLRSDGGETRYRLRGHHAHHHYLVCRACGRALEVVFQPAEDGAKTVGEAYGFREVTHNFELFGLCDRCHG